MCGGYLTIRGCVQCLGVRSVCACAHTCRPAVRYVGTQVRSSGFCVRACVLGAALPCAGSVWRRCGLDRRGQASAVPGERRCPRSYLSVPLPESTSVFPPSCCPRVSLAVVGCGVDLGLGWDLEGSPVADGASTPCCQEGRARWGAGREDAGLLACVGAGLPRELRLAPAPCRPGCVSRTHSAVVLPLPRELVCPAADLGDPTNLFNFSFQTFDANDLYQGQNFNKVLSSLVTLNKVTAGKNFLLNLRGWEDQGAKTCAFLFGLQGRNAHSRI